MTTKKITQGDAIAKEFCDKGNQLIAGVVLPPASAATESAPQPSEPGAAI